MQAGTILIFVLAMPTAYSPAPLDRIVKVVARGFLGNAMGTLEGLQGQEHIANVIALDRAPAFEQRPDSQAAATGWSVISAEALQSTKLDWKTPNGFNNQFTPLPQSAACAIDPEGAYADELSGPLNNEFHDAPGATPGTS